MARRGKVQGLIFVLLLALGGAVVAVRLGDRSKTAATPVPQSGSVLTARATDAARAATDQDLTDKAAAQQWLGGRSAQLDKFVVASRAALIDGDCTVQASAIQGAVGDFDPWVADIRTTPDQVLGETLVAASVSARGTVSACASAQNLLAEQRADLEASLAAFEARRAQVLS